MQLSDMRLQKLPAPERGQKLYRDDSLPKFFVRVSQGGTKTFLLIIDRRYLTIGRYGLGGLTLSEARQKAAGILRDRVLGIVQAPSPTFRAVKAEYLGREGGARGDAPGRHLPLQALRRPS